MSETEILTMLKDKPWLALLALVAWAELRFLPLVLDAIGWNRAVGAKVGVTEEEAKAHRPPTSALTSAVLGFLSRMLDRLFRRPPNGGPPPAAALGVLALVLALSGCTAQLEPQTIDMVRGGLAHNLSVAAVGSEAETREEAIDNAALLGVVLRDATGQPLPESVQARLDAHRAARAGGGGR